MHLTTYISLLGLSLSLPVHGAALPRSQRSGRHNRFVLVRSPQLEQDSSDATSGAVVTAAAEVTNSGEPDVIAESNIPMGSNSTEAYGTTLSDTLSAVNNNTGYDTIPTPLNLTDPAVSQVVSALIPTSTTYPTFSYSAYEPAPTIANITATSSAELPSFTSSALVNPVDQALRAAQSYALHQEMGKHMPTVTIELVMLPTQEPDGTWNYVVQMGTDGTATAVPTFVPAATAIPQSSSASLASPAQNTPTSPYIHTTAAAPAAAFPTEPVSGEQHDVPEQGTTLPNGSSVENEWQPVSSSESYYVGQGYVSALSSDGRGAVTFAYSTAAQDMTATEPSPAEATAWTSGRGQQHAYPWVTANSDGVAVPEATHSAWTSGRGQQHAYPWATASQNVGDTPAPTATAWTSGKGQQHAYPWATHTNSVDSVSSPQETASADANGVIIATFAPVVSIPVSTTVVEAENPWLVSATLSTKASQASASQEGTPLTSTTTLSPAVFNSVILASSTTGSETVASGVTNQVSATWSDIHASETGTGTKTEASNAASSSAVASGISDLPTPTEQSLPVATLSTQTVHGAGSSPSSMSASGSVVGAESTASVSEPVEESSSLSTTSASETATAFVSTWETLASVPTQTISTSTDVDESASAGGDASSRVAAPTVATVTGLATESPFVSTGETTATSPTESVLASAAEATAASTTGVNSASTAASSTESASISTGEPMATSLTEATVSASSTKSASTSEAEPMATSPVESSSASATAGIPEEDDSSFATETVTAWTTVDVIATSMAETTKTTSSFAAESSSTDKLTYANGNSASQTASGATQTSTQATLETLASSAFLSVTSSSAASETTSLATASESIVPTVTASGSTSVASSMIPTTTAESSASSATMSLETALESASLVTSTTQSAESASSTDEAGIPYCEEEADGEWEEVWVDEDDVQPDWEVLE